MKRILFYAILATMFCCVACEAPAPNNPQDVGVSLDNSILTRLQIVKSIYLYTNPYIDPVPDVDFIELNFIGDHLTNDEFNEAIEKLGDTEYKGNVLLATETCTYNRIVSMDIVSSAQFNDIPAGESLASKTMLLTSTLLPYIESNYKDEGDWSDEIRKQFSFYTYKVWYHKPKDLFHPIVTLLSELKPDDMMLLCDHSNQIRFTEVPEVKEHTFTITATDENGNVIKSREFAYTFLK